MLFLGRKCSIHCPEGGALWKALLQLVKESAVQRVEKMVRLIRGAGYKYLENIYNRGKPTLIVM